MNFSEKTHLQINSIKDLVTVLSETEKNDYAEIMHSLDLPLSAYEECSTWCKDCYTRNCIANNESFELILLCWEKGQETPIHDHGGEECWVKVIEGEFEETIYKKNNDEKMTLTKSSNYTKGDVSYMVDFMGFHRLKNNIDGRTISLHLYAKPIRSCQLFDEESETFVRKTMSYDTSLETRGI